MEDVSHMTQRKTGQDEVNIDVQLESPVWNVIHIECNMFFPGDRYQSDYITAHCTTYVEVTGICCYCKIPMLL